MLAVPRALLGCPVCAPVPVAVAAPRLTEVPEGPREIPHSKLTGATIGDQVEAKSERQASGGGRHCCTHMLTDILLDTEAAPVQSPRCLPQRPSRGAVVLCSCFSAITEPCVTAA